MTENFCTQHGVAYFKKGGMKGYAHPLLDENDNTIGWCNKPKQDMSAMEESAKAGHLVEEAQKQGATVERVVDKKDEKITRAVAFKGAIELAASGKITIEEIDGYTATFIPIVRGW